MKDKKEAILIVTRTFNYDKDRLTKITGNDIILNVNYDDYGNVIEYDTSSYTYNSRNLMDSFSGIKDLSGDILYVQCQYKYNYQGVRCEKIKTATLNGRNPVSTSVKYHLNGSTILEEDWLNSSGNIVEKMEYFYDAEGICGIRYNDHNFTLIKDSLGNVSKVMYQGKVIGEYEYNAWGECTVIEHSIDKDNDAGLRDRFVLHNNPFRYKGYYWDSESNLYYCNYIYYSPILCRWLSPDSIEYLDPQSINGLNLYCYCANNPIMYADPSGHMPEWLRDILDIGLYVVSAAISIAVGIAVSSVATPAVGVAAGIATFGALNNLTNNIYYNYISDGESDLTSSSYRDGYVNRWDRLDYVKHQTGQDMFNTTAWMYFSEYNLHMYGWYLTGWALGKNIPLISKFAKSTEFADINVGKWDSRWYVNVGIVILGLLGL